MSKLKCEVIGYIGQDATVGENNGRKVLNFSVAHSVKFVDQNGVERENTTWVNCAMWNDRAAENLCQYLKKGTLIVAEGEPSTRPYKTKDGQCAANFDLNVKDVRLLSSGLVVEELNSE